MRFKFSTYKDVFSRTLVCNFIVSFELVASLNAMAQPVVHFSGVTTENSVYLNFTLVEGITCYDLEIQRAGNELVFSSIGTIAGICGSSQSDVTYDFVDNAPMHNAVNHYRLFLPLTGYFDTIQVLFFSYIDDAYVFPNPVTEKATSRFRNSKQDLTTVEITDLAGKVLRQYLTNDNIIQLDCTALNSGSYVVRIWRNDIEIATTLFNRM